MEFKIFVVEDDHALFEALKTGLEAWAFRVSRPDDFDEVMRSFIDQQPHLVIMTSRSLNLMGFIGAERFAPYPRYLLFFYPLAIIR